MPIRFRFRLVPFIATLIVIAIGISLAQWQTRRAAGKVALAAQLTARQALPSLQLHALLTNPAAVEYRRVLVKGEFLRNWPIYLDNRPHDGIAGFYLLMPFKIAASNLHVLVARGWFPRNAAHRTSMPRIPTPSGSMEIEGIARRDIGHLMQLGAADALRPDAIVQNLDVAEFASASQLKMQPVILEQVSDTGDGLVRDWPWPATGVERHRAYAFQWYALAAMAFIFFIVTGFRRGKK